MSGRFGSPYPLDPVSDLVSSGPPNSLSVATLDSVAAASQGPLGYGRGRMTPTRISRLIRYHRRHGTRRTARRVWQRVTSSLTPISIGADPGPGSEVVDTVSSRLPIRRRDRLDLPRWPERPSLERVTFRRGWIASNQPLQHDIADPENGWSVAAFGTLDLRIHPDLDWCRVRRDHVEVAILGDVVDVENPTIDAKTISGRLLDAYMTSGPRSAIRYAAYLGGRFTALIWSGDELLVVPDAVASMPTYWAGTRGGVVFSSWSHLVAEVAQSQVNERLLELIRHARATGGMSTIFAPGIETPFLDVYPLLPNHLLLWETGRPDTVRHERFYPWPDATVESGFSDPYTVFADIFSEHTRLLCQLGRVGISLTAGLDSNATLAAAWPWLAPDSFSWTYHRFDPPDEGMRRDLIAANRKAVALGLPHRVLDLPEPTTREFIEGYGRSLGVAPQFRRLSAAYFEQLPHGIVELQSMVAEVGTGFYKRRTATDPTPEVLARIYANSDFGALPEVVEAHERFIAYAGFDRDGLGEADFYDLFYWESRLGRWGTLRMQECDLSHRLVLPFNQRRLIEALQSEPFERRVGKSALQQYVQERPLTPRSSSGA
jgi:hypothetical protein